MRIYDTKFSDNQIRTANLPNFMLLIIRYSPFRILRSTSWTVLMMLIGKLKRCAGAICIVLQLYSIYTFQAFCEPGKVKGNGVLAFTRYVLFPILAGEGTL